MFGITGFFGDWMLRMAAFAAGISQPQLDLIERRLPNLRKLIAIITKAQPLIEKFVPIANEATPLVQEALPLIQAAAEEIQVLGPVFEVVLGVIERDTNAGKTREQAVNNIMNTLKRI